MHQVTLTFDNGPTAETTPQVLDILRRRRVPATFFVVGRQLAEPGLRDLAVRAHAEGHRIGNHSYTHSIPFGELENAADAVGEITRTQALIGALAGDELLFRPFGGGGHLDRRLLNAAAVAHLEARDYTLALWNSVPRDWEDPAGWPARALDDCARTPWSVVVLHDLPTEAMQQLDGFIGALADRGVRFTQQFPAAVTPIVRGRRVGELQDLSVDGVPAQH
ncbi:MAG: polysaccharide deacetylase family protein [Nevskia sp.]|nr:polysaccharide deacetylase family protein [Nevskia sp.]